MPQTPLGSLQRFPDSLAVYTGPTSKGRGGKGLKENGKKEKKERKGKEGVFVRPPNTH